jgi:AAA+ ATPase superfamily predicted ATPase
MWDELIWLPLPGLDRHLVSIGKQDREEGMKAIAYVAGAFRQGWAARRALLELTAYDVQTSKSLASIATISETLSWLPPETRAAYKSLLLGLDTVSKHAKAALESDTLYNRQEQLRLALNTTQSMRQGFAYDPNWQVSHVMSPALETWERLLADELALAQKQEAIPNVYVAGRPLDTKSKVFRGRRDVFKALERELISPAEQRPAILLFGARRTGKTSILRQMPETLGPQVISVAVDLQDAALEKDAAGLLYRISEKIRNDAVQFRHIEFEELPRADLEGNPYSAFSEWLKKLQKTLGERWFLLNLDEYEYLEKMTADGRLDDRIFQLLRTLLQNHPRLTLLFSGAHTFEDLSPIWSHHLINARVIKVNPLSEAEARELITRPIPEYPLVYTENAVKDILSVTACQPYLIQAICRDLVNRMNEERRFHAGPKDVVQAVDSVLVSASPYFQDLWSGSDTDETQRTIMGAIARSCSGKLTLAEIDAALQAAGVNGQVEKIRQTALRTLEHRDVLKSGKTGWEFEIELVRRWIRQKQLGLKK